MSAESMIETMKVLVSVHRELNEQAKEKTETLKNGDMEALETLMKKEEAAVSKLKELEELRVRQVDVFLGEKGMIGENVTMSQLLKVADPEEEQKLLQIQHQLTEEIILLKQQNALNQELIEQSLQFVNVSLNLYQPEKEPANYGRPDQTKNSAQRGRSLFDSQA
ncbi:MAG TPA: flagellar protein FlgN [Bacillales bacterium]